MASKDTDGGGLSVSTLIIASLSSLAAALVVHEFWQGGAIFGAAITPVIVAIVSEGLRKPVDAVKARTGTTTVNPPPVVRPEREDRFGIWEEQRKRPLHLKLAIATGVVAFAIAAFFLTGAELVLGGADDADRFRVLPGKQEKDRRAGERDQQPATTQEQEEPEPAPEEEQEAPPTVTVTAPPEETTPEEAPPEETTPVPGPGGTVPVEP